MKRPYSSARRNEIRRAAGAGISRMRARAGFTQDEVAEALGVGSEAVSRFERGLVDLGISRMVELADLFECGIDELLMESSNRPADQASVIASEIAALPAKERETIAAFVRQFAELLRPKGKRQADNKG